MNRIGFSKKEARVVKVGEFVRIWWWKDNKQTKRIFEDVLIVKKEKGASFLTLTKKGIVEWVDYDQIIWRHGNLKWPEEVK